MQHLIQQQGELVWRLVSGSNAYIYISGNSNQMPQDVSNAFRDVFRQFGSMKETEADAYMNGLEKQGRYQMETWS